MKQLAAIVCMGMMGFVQAQSTSTDVEIYERYENGELVEQRQSATENGVPIENFDFDAAKRDMDLKTSDMTKRMDEMVKQSEQKMEEMMQRMDQKMKEFENRTQEMQQHMEQKMKEMDSKNSDTQESPKTLTPAPSPESGVGTSSKEVKFT